MDIFMKNGSCHELTDAVSAAEAGIQLVCYDRQQNEVARVSRADIHAYSMWAIAGASDDPASFTVASAGADIRRSLPPASALSSVR